MSDLPENIDNPTDLDQGTIKQFFELQTKELAIESQRLEVNKLNIQENTKLAMKSMELQADILKKEPIERRKGRQQLFAGWGITLLIILIFMAYCIGSGHEEFAKYFIEAIKYMVALFIGYLGGRLHKPHNVTQNQDGIEDAHIMT